MNNNQYTYATKLNTSINKHLYAYQQQSIQRLTTDTTHTNKKQYTY